MGSKQTTSQSHSINIINTVVQFNLSFVKFELEKLAT